MVLRQNKYCLLSRTALICTSYRRLCRHVFVMYICQLHIRLQTTLVRLTIIVFLSRVSMPMHAKRDIVTAYPSVRPSIRLSVTLWYCIEMTSHIVKLFPSFGRGTTLLFCALPPLQNFKGNSLSGGDKNTLEWKNFQYSTEVAVYYAPDL